MTIFRQKIFPTQIWSSKGTFWAKTGPFGASLSPEEGRYQAKVCGNHEFNPGGAVSGSWDQIWSSGALLGPLGPPKGTFWAKTGPFGAPGGPEEGRYQAKVCGKHVTNPVGPISGSWDQIWPPRPSEDLRGPKNGILGPKRDL